MGAAALVFLVVFVIAFAALFYYLYRKYIKASGSSLDWHSYYSGYWHYGMLSGMPTQGQTWQTVGALSPTNNPANPLWSPSNLPSPATNMSNYSSFTTLALAAGTYDSAWNMDSDGNITGGNVGSNSTGGTNPAPLVMPYPPSTATNLSYFSWGIDSTGALYNEGVGSKLQLVPTMDKTLYPPTLAPDSAWPPHYMALTFASSPAVDNVNYFAYAWSYDTGKLKALGPIMPSTTPSLSYASTLTCTVQLPTTSGGTTTTSVVYFLNAGGLYYLNRSANQMNLGGPAMLTNSMQGVAASDVAWYDTINNTSFSMMWQQDKVCDVYNDTLKALQGGGGSCSPAPGSGCVTCFAVVNGQQNFSQYETCANCSGGSTCSRSVSKNYVGYWYEFQPPAANPNSSSSS